MDLITRANWKEMEVERKMCDALKELLSDELQEANARGKSEGRSEGRSEGITLAKQVFKLSAQGGSTGCNCREMRYFFRSGNGDP